MCATFVVYVISIESLDRNLCGSLVGSSGRKPWSTVKSILWMAVWNKTECQKKRGFHAFNLKKKKKKKAFTSRGLCPLTPTGAVAPGSTKGLLRPPDPHFQAFWLSSTPISAHSHVEKIEKNTNVRSKLQSMTQLRHINRDCDGQILTLGDRYCIFQCEDLYNNEQICTYLWFPSAISPNSALEVNKYANVKFLMCVYGGMKCVLAKGEQDRIKILETT